VSEIQSSADSEHSPPLSKEEANAATAAQKSAMHKKIKRLQQQVRELTQILKIEEENNQNVCKICLTKEIDTVFLPCAHRVMCRHCAHEAGLQSVHAQPQCPICRGEVVQVVRTFNC
jgi:hypothetical protein